MNPASTLHDAHLETLAARVEERAVGPCRLLTLHTPVRDVVSWRGCFTAHPDFAAGDELVQALTVSLLDKGTRRRDRFALADVLENRGAQLHFSTDGLRVACQGQALRKDLPEVLEVMAEELRQPLFDAAEFEKAKAQYLAGLQRSLENTAAQANGALSRRLYSRAHPNYTAPTQEAMERLDGLAPEQVRAYHTRHFGANDLILVFVGDVDSEAVAATLGAALGDWPTHQAPPAFAASAAPQPPGRTVVSMPGKHNVDVRMGHPLRVLRQDADYLPLHVANYILGGNFSARLMTRVRNEMGLTYGINAALDGITTEYEGHWQVGVTLSLENVEKGIEATLTEVRRFVEEGVTEDEVRAKKTTITGAFKVGLATTGGLAATLLLNATRGFDVGYLDRFPAEVEALTRPALNDAISRHFHPDAFQVVLAGMQQP